MGSCVAATEQSARHSGLVISVSGGVDWARKYCQYPIDNLLVSTILTDMSTAQSNYIASLYGDRTAYALNAACREGIIDRAEQSASGWSKRPATKAEASAVIDWLTGR